MYGNINEKWIHNSKSFHKTPQAFTDECLQISKEETIPKLNTLLYGIKKVEIFSKLFYEARIILILKFKKNVTRKEITDPYPSWT